VPPQYLPSPFSPLAWHALAVRAGASGTVSRWAVSSVAAIGIGAFGVSLLALRDLMRAIRYGHALDIVANFVDLRRSQRKGLRLVDRACGRRLEIGVVGLDEKVIIEQ
jgi:hypothetical protein